MSLFGKLADLFVQISAKGVEEVQKAFTQTQTGVLALSAAAQSAGSSMAAGMAKMGAGLPGVSAAAAAAQAAMGALAAKAQGIAGSSQGAAQLASAFRNALTPMQALQAAVNLVGTATTSAIQKASGWPGVAPAIGAVSAALGKASGALASLGTLATSAGSRMRDALLNAAAGIPGMQTSLSALGTLWKGVQSAGQGLGLNRNPFSLGEIKWTGAGLVQGFQGASQAAVGLNSALGPVISRLTGFVQAGFAASGAGQRFQLLQQQLSNQIASLFAPQIEKLVEWMQQLVDWFRNLSGEEQDQLATWGLWLAGIAGAAVVLPTIISTVQALGMALGGLKAVMAGLSLSNPWLLAAGAIGSALVALGAWKPILTWIAGAAKEIAGVFGGIAQAVGLSEPKGKEPKGHRTLAAATGGFEGVEQTWKRIALASRNVGSGRNSTEDIRDLIRDRVLEELRGLRIATEQARPSTVR